MKRVVHKDWSCRAMNGANKAGITLWDVIFIIIVLYFLFLVIAPLCLHGDAQNSAKAAAMKYRGRHVWMSIVSANEERKALGLAPLWPKEQGFDGSRTSTEYFRRLMSDTNGCLTTGQFQQVVSNLGPKMLCGIGVPDAPSTTQFSRTNNAWSVVCVGEETSAETVFLITRNVDLGRRANALSLPKLTRTAPFQRSRAVWITRGGGIFGTRPKYLTAERLGLATNETYDVMYP